VGTELPTEADWHSSRGSVQTAALKSDIAQVEERFMQREGEVEVLVGDYYGLDPH